MGLDPDSLWSLSHPEYQALRNVYVESRGGKPDQGSGPAEWPTQPLEEKKHFLRQSLELAAAVQRQRKTERENLQRTAAAQVQPQPKTRKG